MKNAPVILLTILLSIFVFSFNITHAALGDIPLTIQIPLGNTTYESIDQMPENLIWHGPISKDSNYSIKLKSTDIYPYSPSNPYTTSTVLNYKQANCFEKNKKNECSYPLFFATAPATYTLTVSDQYNNSDSVNFTVKDINNKNQYDPFNSYNKNYVFQPEFTWPISSTIFKTTKSKLVDSKLDFALAYYDTGSTYHFFLNSGKGKEVAFLGEIKMSMVSDQYKGYFDITKKLNGSYYITAIDQDTGQITSSQKFLIQKSSTNKSNENTHVNLYMDDTISMSFPISSTYTKDDAVGDCMYQADATGENDYCIFNTGKKVKKSDLKKIGKFEAVSTSETIYKTFASKRRSIEDCRDIKENRNKETGYNVEYTCFWKGKKLNIK